MIRTRFRDTLAPPWTEVEPLRVGPVSAGRGAPTTHVVVEAGAMPLLRVDVYTARESFASSDVLVWRDHVVIGFGSRVHLVPLSGAEPTSVDLHPYFGGLYPLAERLLVASGDRLWCFAADGKVAWKSDVVAVDGVVVHTVADEVISGGGQWDPPEGWRPFRVSLASGAIVGR